MRLLVFGATGPTGRQILAQALDKGHTVTAFARDPAALGVTHERLRVVQGDTTQDAQAIASALEGQDAVASALGRHNTLKSEGLQERSMSLIVPAMERAGVKRLLVVSAMGVGGSHEDAPWLPRLMYKALLRDLFADKQAAEDLIRQSSLQWTFAYPTMLTNGPLTGRYRAAEKLELTGLPKISRADVAHFVLAELEQRRFVRRTAVLSD